MRNLLFVVLVLLFVSCSKKKEQSSEMVISIAGDGTQGYAGDGGPASSSKLSYPTGVAWSKQGDIFIADHENGCIRKIDAAGIITIFAGRGYDISGDNVPATIAALKQPETVAVDDGGNVYCSHMTRVVKIAPDGMLTTIAGRLGGTGYSGDGGPATAALLSRPVGIAVGSDGSIYICDQGYNVVRKITTGGVISTVAGNGASGLPGDGGPATAAQLMQPYGIAVYNGDLYISEIGSSRVRKVNSAGVISTVAGTTVRGFSGDGGVATAAQMNAPAGIIFDGGGNMYVGDGNRIRKITPGGIISTYAGDGNAHYDGDGRAPLATHIYGPGSIAFDATGNMLIAASMDNRILKIVKRSN